MSLKGKLIFNDFTLQGRGQKVVENPQILNNQHYFIPAFFFSGVVYKKLIIF